MSLNTYDGPDLNDLEYIRNYLDLPVRSVTGFHLRVFSLMGDRVAVAILKIIYPGQDLDAERLQRSLVAIRASLEYPEMVHEASDRIPAVSLLLLAWLMGRAESTEQRKSIEVAITALKRSTHWPAE